ncbi:TetR family transcriptional regulator [Actinomycetospora sp. NBRC 106375]|uniref:TetR/AcrR family transcriptional regulator n=1 Tax=Actinomycetospora sp. NBRC 106375 TaxID=3032207 RepID=UPI0024A0EBDF|nr:TetR/AcrR family transcriptional regulator [Actinomycetospora sp. NBRC 106375]GLZ46481.1 TetR family transcriptional regulator [Actinomycetospora sp. NBRC 106375]
MTPRPNAGTKGVPRADREQEIVRVASVAFGTQGFAATGIADVARAAGISKPLVYSYFGSKEGLHAACLAEAGDLLVAEIERVARDDSAGVERGLRTLAGMFVVLEDRRHLWRLLRDRTAPSTGPAAEVVARYTERIGALAHEGVLELLDGAGITDELDVSAMVRTWLGIVDSLVDWWVARPDQSAEEMTRRVTRLIGALVADRADAAPTA